MPRVPPARVARADGEGLGLGDRVPALMVQMVSQSACFDSNLLFLKPISSVCVMARVRLIDIRRDEHEYVCLHEGIIVALPGSGVLTGLVYGGVPESWRMHFHRAVLAIIFFCLSLSRV